MMWQDKAYLLGVKRAGTTTLILELLTEKHGRRLGSIQFDPKQKFVLPPACTLDIRADEEPLGEPNIMTLLGKSGGLVDVDKNDIRLIVFATMGKIAAQFLTQNEPARDVFDASRSLVGSLVADDGRWPVHYAGWELALLNALGHASGLDRCRPAFRHGETIYLAPRSGRAVTRSEAGAFLDQMMPLPGLLFGARRASVTEVLQAMEITALLFRRSGLLDDETPPLPEQRTHMAAAIRDLEDLPPAPEEAKPSPYDEQAVKRRLLSSRPLMIGVAGAG